jgi:TatD DNase family protein
MLNVGLDTESSRLAVAAAERHEGVFASAGCHPTEATGFDDARAAEIARLAAENGVVRAIGETGIDYYRETASRAEQHRAFEAQIEIARERDLPIVIHARDPDGETGAVDDVFRILDARGDGVEVILHCFLAPWRVDDAIERGWYCSFSGIVTFPSADDLREAAAKLPDELLLVETDAPYLAPQPVRGKPNEPAHVVSTAEAVAEVRGVTYAALERTVERNARNLFGW